MCESGRFYCAALCYIGCVLVERSGPLRKQSLRNLVYWFCEDVLFNHRFLSVDCFRHAGFDCFICKHINYVTVHF